MNVEVIRNIKVIGGRKDRDDGFFFRTVAMQSQNIQACLDLMLETGIKNLSINSAWGWNPQKKLDFIYDNPWIEGVDIVDNDIDVQVLNSLSHLKRLQLADKIRGVLDFDNFPELEVYLGRWDVRKRRNVQNARNLTHLRMAHFSDGDLSVLKEYSKLLELKMVYCKMHSLDGIELLQSLRKIEFINLPKLDNIDALAGSSGNLRSISIIGSKRLSDYSVIKKLVNLESLGLAAGNPIASASFLSTMNLKNGFIGLEILDKKLDILIEKKIDYKKYKSYEVN